MFSGGVSKVSVDLGTNHINVPLRWHIEQLQDMTPASSPSTSKATWPQWQLPWYFMGSLLVGGSVGVGVVVVGHERAGLVALAIERVQVLVGLEHFRPHLVAIDERRVVELVAGLFGVRLEAVGLGVGARLRVALGVGLVPRRRREGDDALLENVAAVGLLAEEVDGADRVPGHGLPPVGWDRWRRRCYARSRAATPAACRPRRLR